MDGRLTLLVGCLLLVSSGCVNTKSGSTHLQQVSAPAAPSHPAGVDTTPKDDGKRAPRIAAALAAYKEAEARKLDHEPEAQFKVRDQSRKLYQEAVKLDPGYIDAHRGLARVYVDLGDFARAQDTIKKAQARFPKEAIFWFEQAQLHNRKKEFAEAIKSLNKAREIDPENRMYMTTLGLTMARAGMADQAVAVLAGSMGQASAHYNVARMLVHLQRPEDATRHLRLAVQANPNLDNARRLLAQLETGGRPNVSLDIDAGQ